MKNILKEGVPVVLVMWMIISAGLGNVVAGAFVTGIIIYAVYQFYNG